MTEETKRWRALVDDVQEAMKGGREMRLRDYWRLGLGWGLAVAAFSMVLGGFCC